MKEIETYKRIEHYLSGTLSEEEKAHFLQEMDQDPTLAQELEAHRLVHEAIFDQGVLEWKAKVKAFKPPKSGVFRLWTLAAALVLVSGITLIYIFTFQEPIRSKATAGKTLEARPEKAEELQTQKQTIQEQQSLKPIAMKPAENAEAKVDSLSTVVHKSGEEIAPLNDIRPMLAPEEVKTAENPCSQITIKANVQTVPSCKEESNGSVSVTNIQGGQAPYKVILKVKANQWREGLLHQGLTPGSYSLILKDANGCQNTLPPLIIEEKICIQRINLALSLSAGESVSLPVNEESNGEITILDRSGRVVYQEIIRSGMPNQWDGSGNKGYPIEPGVYRYILQYTDGHLQEGHLTITR